MLILKTVALGPVHGYGISLRIRQISKEVLQVQQGSLYPALHRLEKRGGGRLTWANPRWLRAKFYGFPQRTEEPAAEESNWNRLSEAVRLAMQTVHQGNAE